MSDCCPQCNQPLPVEAKGVQLSIERRRIAFPDGRMLRLEPRQTAFMAALMRRGVLGCDELLLEFHGKKRQPKHARTAVRVTANSLRRAFKPFGYTITSGRYELVKAKGRAK